MHNICAAASSTIKYACKFTLIILTFNNLDTVLEIHLRNKKEVEKIGGFYAVTQ